MNNPGLTGGGQGQALMPVDDGKLYVLGLRRSGIHAAVFWMIPQADGVVRFFNDPDLDERRLARPSCMPRYYYATRGNAWPLLNQTQAFHYERDARARAVALIPRQFPTYVRPVVRSLVRKVHRWRGRVESLTGDPFINQNTFVPAKLTFLAFENRSPAEFASEIGPWEQQVCVPYLRQNGFALSAERKTVLILRDPWNQLASILKAPPLEPPRPLPPPQFLGKWLDYAREYLGRTEHLQRLGPVIRFNYNRWFSELEYRRDLAAALGWEHSDAGLNMVTDFGGGSSFDKCRYHQKAQAMAVNDRWRAFADHPLMQELCSDPEVRELSNEIFGEEPPLRLPVSVAGWTAA